MIIRCATEQSSICQSGSKQEPSRHDTKIVAICIGFHWSLTIANIIIIIQSHRANNGWILKNKWNHKWIWFFVPGELECKYSKKLPKKIIIENWKNSRASNWLTGSRKYVDNLSGDFNLNEPHQQFILITYSTKSNTKHLDI